MNVKFLDEFQFFYGDPRPYLFHYMENFSNIELFFKKSKVKKTFINSSEMFVFKCVDKKRAFKEPKNFKLLKSKLDNLDEGKPILIIPVLLMNKYSCSSSNRARHMNILLYNKITKELERIDIKKYHLYGFSLKLFYKKLDNIFLDNYLPDADLTSEVDVSLQFLKKHEFSSAADAFPIFLLAYLSCRNDNPSLKQSKVISLVNKLNTKKIEEIWKNYVDYRKSYPIKCFMNKVENPETGICVNPMSKSFIKNIIDPPPKKCTVNKIYNSLLQRCVSKNKIVDVNVLIEEALSAKYDPSMILKNVDNSATLTIGIMNFILSKYPYGRFIFPTDTKKIEKKNYRIDWVYSDKDDRFELLLPENFWEIWREHMFNPVVRFIIAFVHLKSKSSPPGFHANVLIYDKSTNELERFDGLGKDLHALYNIVEFDKLIEERFNEQTNIFRTRVKYYTPLQYCPKMPVFQMQEINDIPGKDLRGNCAVWRMWYIHVRLENPSMTRKDLVEIASKKLAKTGSLYKFIKSYQLYLLDSYKKTLKGNMRSV